MPKNELPQRDPFIGPPSEYVGATADVVASFAIAVREWAGEASAESSRCRGVAFPGIERIDREVR
ncbi:hypothetical protein ACLMAJ_00605 [Nocardia sp. KC 131]|uniref:hypothetical protein n=1 Tax=Nocardia arseniciresistens TaxID=3392119 RepID=UPI00398F498A